MRNEREIQRQEQIRQQKEEIADEAREELETHLPQILLPEHYNIYLYQFHVALKHGLYKGKAAIDCIVYWSKEFPRKVIKFLQVTQNYDIVGKMKNFFSKSKKL